MRKGSDLPEKMWVSPSIQQNYWQIKLPQRSSALYFVEFRLGARAWNTWRGTRTSCIACAQEMRRRITSRARFWSSDLWVMGPARFHCVTLLLMDNVLKFNYALDCFPQKAFKNSPSILCIVRSPLPGASICAVRTPDRFSHMLHGASLFYVL